MTPSTLGSFLRSFTWGNVLPLEAVCSRLLAELARRVQLLPGADQVAFLGIDSSQRRVYGHKKQGTAFGHTKIAGKTVLIRGLNALVATVKTPLGHAGSSPALPTRVLHPAGGTAFGD